MALRHLASALRTHSFKEKQVRVDVIALDFTPFARAVGTSLQTLVPFCKPLIRDRYETVVTHNRLHTMVPQKGTILWWDLNSKVQMAEFMENSFHRDTKGGGGYHVSATNWQHKIEKNTTLPKLSKNFRLLSADEFVTNKSVSHFTPETRPLVVMLTWMNAKKKRVDQYSNIYLSKGYDVLTVTIDAWQFLFPVNGAQVVAQDLLNYLHHFSVHGNQPLLVHGFSIGAYFWGEVLLKIKSDRQKYSELLDRVKGVIWDSTPDFKDTISGLPNAIAPKNLPLRVMIRSYVTFHLLLFYPVSTRHHIASSKALHTTPCTAPVLMLFCRNDPIASVESNLNVKRSWESLGIKTSMKVWDESKHVSHYFLHTDEYLAEINHFLKEINFPAADENSYQIKSKL